MASIHARVDQLFSEWDRPGSPGCSLAVIQNGEIVYSRGYGLANLEYDIPITPATIFHVASVSKQFTAFAVLLLALQGQLNLDDDVHQYIPELPDFGEMITIRHLIHHTSGLRDQWELLILAGWRMDDVITTADVLELVALQKDLNFKPGDEYTYCNTGYTLLSVIVERVSGKSLREFSAECIFQPLGMQSTHFHDDHNFIVKNRAYSYAPKAGEGFHHSVLSYATVGATSLFTTVEDLARWDQNFYTGAVGGQAAIDQMQSRAVLNSGEQIKYAFGLSIDTYRGLKVVEHSGGDAGFRTHLIRFPEQHFSVAILSNLSTFTPGLLARQVADIYLEPVFAEQGEPLELPDRAEIEKITPAELESFAGVYFNPQTSSSQTLSVKDGKLMVDWGRGLELLPFTRNRFKVALIPSIELRFTGGASGENLQFELLMGIGKPELYTRVTPPALTREDLEPLAGIYLSPELGVNYTIRVKDDQLVLQRRKYGSSPLRPTIPDGFANSEADLIFSRDEHNQIDGFLISTGRVRSLRFNRT